MLLGLRRHSTGGDYDFDFDPRVESIGEANWRWSSYLTDLMLQGMSEEQATQELTTQHPALAARVRAQR